MALTEEQLDALIGAAAENKVGRDTYFFFSNDELVAMQERFLATIAPPASEQKPSYR